MSNRDIAALILVSLVIILGLTRSPTRLALRNLLSALASWKILLPLTLYFLYLAGCVWAAANIGLWNTGLLFEAILWVLVGGIPLMLSIADRDRKSKFPGNHIREILALSGLLIFVVNIASFGLWLELILQFFFMSLVLLGVVAGTKDEYQSVGIVVSVLSMLFVLAFAARSIAYLYTERSEVDWTQIFLSFLMSLWLPLVALPLVALLKLLSDYELAFINFRRTKSSTSAGFRDKLALIWAVRANLALLREFRPYWADKIIDAQSLSKKYEAAKLFVDDGNSRRSAV